MIDIKYRSETNFSTAPVANECERGNWNYDNSIDDEFKWLNRGFTGHEHLYEFELINMNARLYDPNIGRFLAVDNFVQDATSTQGYNRFSYCLNNPLKFTDPSGEIYWAPIVATAVVGGFMNWSLNGFRFDAKGAEYFLIGATAGFVGGIAGAGVAAGIGATGFIAGAAAGSVGGFSSGFITGAGNAWLGGANFGSGLLTGLESGAMSGLVGGGIGGVFGGIDAISNGRDFWSGKPRISSNSTFNSRLKIDGKSSIISKQNNIEYKEILGGDVKGGSKFPWKYGDTYSFEIELAPGGRMVFDGEAFPDKINFSNDGRVIFEGNVGGSTNQARFYNYTSPESGSYNLTVTRTSGSPSIFRINVYDGVASTLNYSESFIHNVILIPKKW